MKKFKRFAHELAQRFNPKSRQRSKVIRSFYDTAGIVNFGVASQHDDEFDVIRGFSSSLTHYDSNFGVGSYDGFDLRMVDRTDFVSLPGKKHVQQAWFIMEIHLHVRNMPHFFFVPTGTEGGSYTRLFQSQPFMQPISDVAQLNRSPQFHGRYQLLARLTKAPDLEHLMTSPVIVGVGERFWPYGVEIEHGRLYIYITDKKLTKSVLEQSLSSALWLADLLIETHENK